MAPRRSPQIHTIEDGAEMSRRRSPRLHPQIHAREDGFGGIYRRSPLLNPQIHTSEEGAGADRIRRRRATSPVQCASLPDDMMREILFRLPPQPSSLPRASAVCRRWRGLITDPKFPCSFRDYHRKPPLLGVFEQNNEGIMFIPVLDPPDRIPPVRFSLGRCSSTADYDVLDCRHGLVLVKDCVSREVVVCDPITGEQRRVAVPPEFKRGYVNGVVLCAAGDLGHVHGVCHSGPFKVVLMSMYRDVSRPTVCVYFWETGLWGNLICTEAPYQLGGDAEIPATLIGNALYWLSWKDQILEFDFDGQTLAVITGPPVTSEIYHQKHQIIRAEDDALGFAVFSFPHFHMWRRNVNGHRVATWVLWKTLEMHTILGLPSEIATGWEGLIGYVEDTDAVILRVCQSVYMVQLKSMQSEKLYETKYISRCHPFTSFYIPGTAIKGGSNGAELLHDTYNACLV